MKAFGQEIAQARSLFLGVPIKTRLLRACKLVEKCPSHHASSGSAFLCSSIQLIHGGILLCVSMTSNALSREVSGQTLQHTMEVPK